MKWLENNCIQVDVTKKPKKITGTRFAAILGSNVWSSPFKAWCEITKTYEDPFKESIYTLAGKIIESRQVNYLKKAYFMEEIKTPVDVYGRDFFKVTYGDFFKNEPIFGGMWDALNYEDKQDRLDVVMGLIKDYMSTQFREGDTKISLSGKTYEYTLSKSSTTKIDKDLLKQDGLLNRYEITSESTRFTKKEIKKEIK